MNDTTLQILNWLRKAMPQYVSGAELCQALGISRAAVWKHIHQLRESGYGIASSPNRGYRLDKVPNIPSKLEVTPLLTTRKFGHELYFFQKTDSTNRLAADMARNGKPEGTVVVADSQTAGRGRLQRQWHSPSGQNLYCSLILRPETPPFKAPQAALIAGMALCRTIRGLLPKHEPQVKWPNDVFLEGRKIAGILCAMVSEMERVEHLVVGIGINVNITRFPDELASLATSLQIVSGREFLRPLLLAKFLADLENAYSQWLLQGLESFMDEWSEVAYLTGRRVKIDTLPDKAAGKVLGISPDGALLIREDDGHIRSIASGDVYA